MKLTRKVSDTDRVLGDAPLVFPGWVRYGRKIAAFDLHCRWWWYPVADFCWEWRLTCYQIRFELRGGWG